MGFSALLLTISPIRQVLLVESFGSLINNLETIEPALVLLDTALLDPTLVDARRYNHIDEIDRLAPGSLRVLLTEGMAEFRDLICYTQDTVVVKGTEPARLAQTLEHLLQEHIAAA